MFRSASDLNGYSIGALDGPIGHVSDVLFDDQDWRVRWVVVETGNWLVNRKVLLPPSALHNTSSDQHAFSVKLTIDQVKNSPNIDTDKSVSRQMETYVYEYYSWSPYWGDNFYAGGSGYIGGIAGPPSTNSRPHRNGAEDAAPENGDLHLRSAHAIKGYHIHASDGVIGHVQDLLVEDADWSIRNLIVDTSDWFGGKKVIASPQSVKKISWAERSIWLDVKRQEIKDGPAYKILEHTHGA
jgi:sporulation protein YlmC with PRC-barrel domain